MTCLATALSDLNDIIDFSFELLFEFEHWFRAEANICSLQFNKRKFELLDGDGENTMLEA